MAVCVERMWRILDTFTPCLEVMDVKVDHGSKFLKGSSINQWHYFRRRGDTIQVYYSKTGYFALLSISYFNILGHQLMEVFFSNVITHGLIFYVRYFQYLILFQGNFQNPRLLQETITFINHDLSWEKYSLKIISSLQVKNLLNNYSLKILLIDVHKKKSVEIDPFLENIQIPVIKIFKNPRMKKSTVGPSTNILKNRRWVHQKNIPQINDSPLKLS